MQDDFNALRPYLTEYLRMKGVNPNRRFRCLNPSHIDKNPSMGYDPHRQKVHCFACGADYDLFDLLMLDENLSSPTDALDRARQLFKGHQSYKKATSPKSKKEEKPDSAPPLSRENTRYIFDCAAAAPMTPYFAQRGLSPQTVARFHLGYDAKRDCVVLPCEKGYVVRRSISEKQYLNEKGYASPLFQPELLQGRDPVFLLEGTFDALSAEELGFAAAALNGSGNREKAAAILRRQQKTSHILLLPDNDQAGESWAAALEEEFPDLFRCPPLPAGKDLNEMLVMDREQAAAFLRECLTAWQEALPPPYETFSAAGQMDAFHRYIEEQAKKPALATGFSQLDQSLDGGLYDGLYVLGAVSSLGKTAFCMQIADQLAGQGRDVLIFTLEMTAYELMARSISRETFLLDGTKGRKYAKTVRGVLDGRRRQNYTEREHAHLEFAVERYAAYAGHLWFREGDHETGIEVISREIVRHIDETGNRPVVLIDYLQIIAPMDVHFTDKQNLDRIICALKKLSRTHSLTVLAISSFNRENYNVEATMAAFKESGGIDYSADVLLGLQARGAGSRSFNIEEEKRKDPRELELKILKNRSAALGKPIPFRYYPAFSCFEES